MRKTALLLVVGALVLAVAGGAASAQEGAAQGYPVGGEPPPPPADYAYLKGEVYIDGDLVIGCREFAADFEDCYDERGDQVQARRVLERCERAGLPALRVPAEVRAEMRGEACPRPAAPRPPLVVGVLLAGAGLGALLGVGAKEGR